VEYLDEIIKPLQNQILRNPVQPFSSTDWTETFAKVIRESFTNFYSEFVNLDDKLVLRVKERII
jgi:hypothetical protein